MSEAQLLICRSHTSFTLFFSDFFVLGVVENFDWDKLWEKQIEVPWKPPANFLQTAACTKQKISIPDYDNNPTEWPEGVDPFQHI